MDDDGRFYFEVMLRELMEQAESDLHFARKMEDPSYHYDYINNKLQEMLE